jgi:hypothetical protein
MFPLLLAGALTVTFEGVIGRYGVMRAPPFAAFDPADKSLSVSFVSVSFFDALRPFVLLVSLRFLMVATA